MFKNILTTINTNLNDLVIGDDTILINQSDNLLKESEHYEAGYFIKEILNKNSFDLIKNRLTLYVEKRIEEILHIKIENFSLENYHKYVTNDEDHFKIAVWELEVDILSGIEEEIQKNISQSIHADIKFKKIIINDNLQEIIGFRIVRPLKNDENPFHRDSWMKQWENTLNVWIPIAGCNEGNSLVVVENSHMWNDSKICRTKNGVVYNNKKFKVSAAISTDYNVKLAIPHPNYGEALIFSPYLIHGNAKNNLKDTTRVSIELRYERAK